VVRTFAGIDTSSDFEATLGLLVPSEEDSSKSPAQQLRFSALRI